MVVLINHYFFTICPMIYNNSKIEDSRVSPTTFPTTILSKYNAKNLITTEWKYGINSKNPAKLD